MRVTRLEIFGFKSFVDRFVLNFDKNMIGIVGPNGCGKSNVVDSLRWVLGETHAKQLRGGVLEDLIFNGSDSRRPLGMAEVSLTVRPHEGWAPATLMSLQELARSDRGDFGKEDEEKDAEEISPEEEKLAQDESEPVSVASLRANSAATLLQLPGLFDSTEIQLTRRLYRSGESEYFINRVPCRLRDLIEFYRIIGLGSRGLSIVQQGQVGDIISRKPEELRELLEEAAGIAGFRARIDAAERRLQKTVENLSRLKDLALEREKHVRSLQRQAKRAKERNTLREELKQRELTLFQTRGALILKRDEAGLQELTTTEEAHTAIRAELEQVTASIQDASSQLESKEDGISQLRRSRDEVLSEVRKLQEKEQALRLSLSRLESRAKGNRFQLRELHDNEERTGREIAQLRSRLEESAPQLESLKSIRAETEEKLRETLSKSPEQPAGLISLLEQISTKRKELEGRDSVRAELNRIHDEIRIRRGRERELAQLIQQKRTELAKAEGQERAIAEQLDDLAKRAESALQGEREHAKVLLSGITAPEGLEHALLAALGEQGRYLVSESPEELLQRFSEEKFDRPGFGVIRGGNGNTRPPGEERFVDALKVEPWARSAVERIIGDLYIADDIDAAQSLRKRYGENISIVTRTGVLLAPWGFYATGESGLQSYRLTRLLEESRTRVLKLTEDIRALTDSEGDLHQEMRQLEDARSEQERMLVALDAVAREISSLEQQERAMERALLDERLRIERTLQQQLREASNKVSAFEGQLSSIQQSLNAREADAARFAERARTVETDWAAIGEEFVQLQSRMTEEGVTGLPSELIELVQTAQVELQFAHDSRLESRLLELETSIADAESALRASRRVVSEQQQRRDSLQNELQKKNELLQDLRLRGERQKLELEHLKSEVLERFQIELAIQESYGALDLPTLEKDERELSEKVRQLKNRLEADGEIDPSVIEEYEVERQKFADLENQIRDLEGAEKTLERSIRHLRELSKIRFLETYKDVSHRFADLVPRLFGGGSGQMELSLPDDPLSTGVIISVRPPGKKQRSLDLLSGGEKALTATAVLLAMFLHRPSPICVLDEVDAPLDDANLERFLNLIREISNTTQMLIITHNKQSMLASDRLIGITMQEAGISKALTVSFEEAVEELERAAANG